MPPGTAMADRSIQTDVTLSRLDEVRGVQADIKDALAANAFDDQEMFYIELAVEETLVNAIKHGNQLDPDKRVFVRYIVDPVQFHIRVEDEGAGFNPADVPDPTAPENLERPCGRGLLLIRKFMTDVTYHGRGNIVTMTRHRANGTH
jgi:serine/threonine-protein kinase RsbW